MTEGYAGDVTPQEAWQMVLDDGAVLVDVRTEAEWRFVGVPDLATAPSELVCIEWVDAAGRRNPAFGGQVAAAAQGRAVVFLCRSGQRSASAALAVTTEGAGPAYNVTEGFEGPLDSAGHRGDTGWRAAGLPWKQS
ncbi:MAG: rhodanese-like domain-containing protein [Actinomycetota bacterium]|nr:rhodanese-like domain-containing protein [Actinomycetota bacterium]